MQIQLPRPHFVLPYTANDNSGKVVAVIYEGRILTPAQFDMLCEQLRGTIVEALTVYKELEGATLVELTLPITQAQQSLALYIQLVTLLDPVYVPCSLDMLIANRGQAALVVASVVLPPYRTIYDIGNKLAVALFGLGDIVSYRRDIPASQGNSCAITIQPFREPPNLGSFLSDALRQAGLAHVSTEVREVSMRQYVISTVPSIRFS